MTLMLHAGAKPASYDDLRSLKAPEPTATHVPIDHYKIVDVLRYTLGFYGHEITEEHHGVTEDGMRYFGVLSLRSNYGDYTDQIGLRNSHDRTFPVGIAIGARVFVCDNLSFAADHVIRRKHTLNAKRDLPGLVGEIIEPLREEREAQALTFNRYRQALLTEQQASHGIMQMYRGGVINLQRIDDVLEQWEKPSYEGFEEPNAWRLFNAATHALAGKVAETPALTGKLHRIIDQVIN